MEHAIVGFELLGDPVLGGEFIAFEEGLNVFYGLNGAGKTRLLTGVRNSMLGIASDIRVGLVARVHRPTADDVEADDVRNVFLNTHFGREQRASGAGLLIALANSINGPFLRDRHTPTTSEATYSLPLAFQNVLAHLRAELEPFVPGDPVEIDTEELKAELLEDRLFLLFPNGTAAAPSWQAWPIADRRRPVIQRWEKRWASLLELDKSEDDNWELVEKLTNVALSEVGAVGNSNAPADKFDGYKMFAPPRAELSSRSFVFFSNQTNADEVPPINLLGAIDFGVDLVTTDLDPDEATLRLLDRASVTGASQSLGLWLEHDEPDNDATFAVLDSRDATELSTASEASTEAADRIATELADTVNRIMSSVLMDPPVASVGFALPILRFSTPAAEWRFQGRGTSIVRLAQLSSAERKWATLAIQQAIALSEQKALFNEGVPLRPTVLIIDEPEAALHRAAEARVADFLLAWTRDPRRIAFVATHSPELLDLPQASLTEISKQGDGTPTSLVRRLDISDRAALERLGLRPSDLLRWPRVFLLVEGEHDRQMIESYFGPRLRNARVQLLPMRGAKQLASTIDSRVLFEYTDATVVALLDNLLAESVHETWGRAQFARISEGIPAAKQIVVEWFADNNSEEARYMSGWLTSALDSGLESRLMPYGLSARDVIEYLPVSEIVPGAVSWEALHLEHQADRALKKGYPNEFKPWLRDRKHVEITETLIQEALDAAPGPPPDMEQMMKTLEAVSSETRAARPGSSAATRF